MWRARRRSLRTRASAPRAWESPRSRRGPVDSAPSGSSWYDTISPKEGYMKYALLIYGNNAIDTFEQLSEEEQGAILGEYMAIRQMPSTVGGDQLQPAETATTVRVENGETLTTDGPFAETKEVLGGFFLVEADDIDGALEIAARIPAARMGGSVEVRPVVER